MRKPRLLIPSIGLLLGVFVISGIVEVLVGGERLGFLGEGAFFGTTALTGTALITLP